MPSTSHAPTVPEVRDDRRNLEDATSTHQPASVLRMRPVIAPRFVIFSAAAVLLLASLWLFRAPILSTAARAYVVDDPLPKQADAIVVLGGGMAYRPTEAARIYRLGVAPRVLVAHPVVTEAVALGLVAPEGEVASAFLTTLGVPSSAIEPLVPEVTSTYEEAMAIHRWAMTHSARRILVPTDIFHTRRVKWVFEKALRGTGVEVCVTAIDPIRYSPDNWWRSEEGVSTFQNEAVKLLYYWARY